MSKQPIEVVQTELEIEENLDLHKKGWTFQRIGWFFIYAIVILAALGMFGDGLLSHTADQANNANLTYDRFHRHEAKMQLKFDILRSNGPVIDIALENKYLNSFRIESVLPDAQDVKVSNGMVHYMFSAQGASSITFYLVPQRPGPVQGKISIDGSVIPISHFIYP